MSVRLLLACTVTLLLMTSGALLIWQVGGAPEWMTAIGLIAPVDLLAVALSCVAGGVIARDGFRLPALVLVLAAGLAGTVAAWLFAGARSSDATRWLIGNSLVPLVLSCVLAWIAAALGERLGRWWRTVETR